MAAANTDCYYYYYSSCAKGSGCPFRHEPAALAQEVVCTYWQAGNCTRNNCIYRHMDVGMKKRNRTKCYWEEQPGGCRKPHCPFLHDRPKDPYPEEVAQMLEKPTQTIIVNRNKIDELSKMILPIRPGTALTEVRRDGDDGDLPRRIVVSGERKASAKSRLGPKIGARDRLADRGGGEWVEIYECSEGEEGGDGLHDLRSSAIKSLDLRNRLTSRRVRRVGSDDEGLEGEEEGDEEVEYEYEELETEKQNTKVKSVVKKVKKEKKLKREKKEKRKEKREKKKKVKKAAVSIGAKTLKSLKEDALNMKITGQDSDEEVSLADRIASKNDRDLRKVDSAKARVALDSGKPVRAEEYSPSPSPPPPSNRSRRKRNVTLQPKESEGAATCEKSTKKAKKRKSAEGTAAGSRKKSAKEAADVKEEDDDLERLLKEREELEQLLKEDEEATESKGEIASGANDTADVIKEMDDLLNE
jgi:hypothetical protein